MRGDAHSNTVESYFAILKRGVYGTFHTSARRTCTAISPSSISATTPRSALGVTDAERADELLRGAKGKRLMYRQPDQAAHA